MYKIFIVYASHESIQRKADFTSSLHLISDNLACKTMSVLHNSFLEVLIPYKFQLTWKYYEYIRR